MKYRTRTYYTDAQKALMWERWKQGWTLHQIGQLFNRAHSSVQGILSRTGGFRPPQRSRSKIALTLAEREEISRAVAEGQSIRSIAARLGRAPSTVSREIKRNGGQENYRASRSRRRRLESCTSSQGLQTQREQSLGAHRGRQAPAAVVTRADRRLAQAYLSARRDHRVSHETIYRSLFIQARGALKKELLQHLRRTRGMRRSRHHTQKTTIPMAGSSTPCRSVSVQRAVEDRAVPGHWEGDLLFGDRSSQIATLVERQTRYVMLVKVASNDTATVVNALIKNARKLPQELYKSLTWDRGHEMAGHKRFTLATDIQVYFCDPRSPWQRGSNENTNGLLRQYLPKGIDISSYSQAKLNAVARQLNERPRKTLEPPRILRRLLR